MMEITVPHRETLQGAGFALNELAEGNGEILPVGYLDPALSLVEREKLASRGIVPDAKLTAAEESYFASRGADISGIFGEHGRNVASDGTIGFTTYDGRVLSGADYVNGFARGDLVQLKSGGPRMVVVDSGRKIYRGVRCEWFVAGALSCEDFEPAALKYLGRSEDLPPESRVTSLDEHREALLRRGGLAAAGKPKRVTKRRAA